MGMNIRLSSMVRVLVQVRKKTCLMTIRSFFLWHRIWGIIMHRIQETMNPQQVNEPDGTMNVMARIIVPKLATAAKCAVTVCES